MFLGHLWNATIKATSTHLVNQNYIFMKSYVLHINIQYLVLGVMSETVNHFKKFYNLDGGVCVCFFLISLKNYFDS